MNNIYADLLVARQRKITAVSRKNIYTRLETSKKTKKLLRVD
jgi:hypothetical protein